MGKFELFPKDRIRISNTHTNTYMWTTSNKRPDITSGKEKVIWVALNFLSQTHSELGKFMGKLKENDGLFILKIVTFNRTLIMQNSVGAAEPYLHYSIYGHITGTFMPNSSQRPPSLSNSKIDA